MKRFDCYATTENGGGKYVLYEEANSIIGDLRKKLQESNAALERARQAGFDPRYPYSEAVRRNIVA